MSPPSKRIEEWIVHMGFDTREEVEQYVRIHGGASLTMDATLDLVYGGKEPELPLPRVTELTPLEQLQRGELPIETQPTRAEEQAIPPEVRTTQPPVQQEQKKSLIRRFLDFLGAR